MPSDKSGPAETNAQTAELLDKFKSEYPKAPDPSKVWTQRSKNAFKREIDRYNNKDETDSKIPRYFAEMGPLKYQNFVRHVLKNIRHLENSSNSIYMDHERQSCERLYAEFLAETKLQSAVMRAIMGESKFEKSSSDVNATKSRRELLMEGATEVQVILKSSGHPSDPPSEKEKREGYSVVDLWKDKWHPINLTMSFDMFQRFVNLIILQRKNPLKEFTESKGHENTYKRHYLKYMFKCAESNQEFLLAIISFGTDVRFFPSKLLELLQSRGLLKEEFDAYKPPNPISFKGFTFSMGEDSIIPKRNKEYFKKLDNPSPQKSFVSAHKSKPLIQIVKLIDLTEDVDVDNFADTHNKSRKKSNDDDRRQSSAPSSSSKQSSSSSRSSNKSPPSVGSKPSGGGDGGNSSSKVSSQSGKSRSPVRTTGLSTLGIRTLSQEVTAKNQLTDDNGNSIGISEEVFRECTRKLWQLFFEPGFNLAPSIAAVWYQQYVKHVKVKKDQLNNCVDMLLQDRQKSSYFDIPRLHESMIQEIEADFKSLELSRKNAGQFNLTTVEGLMYSQASTLQLSLHDHTINKSIPGPMGWSPTNSQMPYQAFEGHLEWRLAQLGKALDGLEIEMVKLRYVEYLSLVSSEGKYLLLGVFTAYGPDLYSYPIRVLQLLKKKQVFRAGTRLYTLIQLPVDGRAYTALVPMKGPPSSSERSTGGSLLGRPPLPLLPIPSFPVRPPHPLAAPPFQPPMLMQPPMDIRHPYAQPPYFQQESQQYLYNQPIHHPMGAYPNGYSQGVEGDYRNQYQAPTGAYMHQQDSHFINPVPQPVPTPSQPVNNAILSNMPMEGDRQEPPKPNPLPSILPLDAWKVACERSLAKYGPKYGIGRLSEKDYKVLYDRYLFDTFEHPDDFVRGILTGISLAKYPRDDEEPINTSGLLNLPSLTASSQLLPPKSILKPILKNPAPAQPQPNPAKPNSIKMSRDDLLRISSLIEHLIPNAETLAAAPTQSHTSSTAPPRTMQLESNSTLVDYNHYGNERDDFDTRQFRRPSPPTGPTPEGFDIRQFRRASPPKAPPPLQPRRRNYDEEDRGYEDRDPGRVIDYDHLGSTSRNSNPNSGNSGFYQRPTGPSGRRGGGQGRGNTAHNKRGASNSDVYEELLQKRYKNADLSDYNYQ